MEKVLKLEYLPLILTLGATFCWASGQVLGKVAVRDIGSMVFNTVRFSSAAIVIGVAMILFEPLNFELGLPFLVAITSGIFGWFVATYIYFYSLKRGSAHRIIPTGNAYPFWAILLSALFLPEDITLTAPIAAALVIGGTYMLSRRRELDRDEWKWGVPVASIVAFLWGANAILNKFALNADMPRLILLFVRVISAAMAFWIVSISTRRRFFFPNRSLSLSVLSGLISFPIGSFLYIWSLSNADASTLAPVTGGTVFFGFLLSVLFLDENVTKDSILGVIFILAGIFLMAF